MATVIEISPLRIAAGKIWGLILQGAFVAVFALSVAPDENLFFAFKIVFGLCAFLCALFMLFTVVKMIRVLTTKGPWRAEIKDHRLTWVTALGNETFPIDVALNDIEKVVQLERTFTGSDNETALEVSFEIHHSDGTQTAIRHDDSGIDPHRVFKALSAHGVPYHLCTLDQSEDKTNLQRDIERVF